MLRRIVRAFERLMYRLFCGAECWKVEYTVYFSTGHFSGVHMTYKSLSKYIPARFNDIGFELAKEICAEIRFKTGIVATGCKIISVQKVW